MRLSGIVSAVLLFIVSGFAIAQETAGSHVDDTVLHTKVKTALVEDDAVGGLGINVETYNGIIQLSGFVKTEKDRTQAGSVASGVEGAGDVRNRLFVQSDSPSLGQRLDDTVISTKVKAALADDNNTNAISILVDTRNGVVLLSGFVPGESQKLLAMKIAEAVNNVQSVINGMDVHN